MRDRFVTHLMTAAGIGLAVGAGVALLTAPASGRRTRQRIATWSRKRVGHARRAMTRAQHRAHDVVDQAQRALRTMRRPGDALHVGGGEYGATG